MKLREPEALGLFDDDDVRRGNVDANLQHGRSDQYLKLARPKRLHQRAALFSGKATVNLTYAIFAKPRLHFVEGLVDTDELVRRRDRWTHDERSALSSKRPLDLAKHRGALRA